MAREKYQRGSLRQEDRQQGRIWIVPYSVRKPDGRRVEHTRPLALVAEFPTEAEVRKEMERRGIVHQINNPNADKVVLFRDLCDHFIKHELAPDVDSDRARSHTTVTNYKQHLHRRIIPRWGDRAPGSIQTLEVEEWLQELRRQGLANPTRHRIRCILSLIFKCAQRYKLIPKGDEHNPMIGVRCRQKSVGYRPVILTPAQAHAIWERLVGLEKVLVLTIAFTGLRASEGLGLKWEDIEWDAQAIHIRRGFSGGAIGETKTIASRGTVPLHPLLAEHLLSWRRETPYARDHDWVFASTRRKGKKPRSASILIEDYVRPAAIAAGVLKNEDTKTRFGLHNFRHALATWLAQNGTGPHVVRGLLRHANVTTTLGHYTHTHTAEGIQAQQAYADAFFASESGQSG